MDRSWLLIIMVLFISGCSEDLVLLESSTLSTINNTIFSPSRSFELQKFCSSMSFSSSRSSSNLSCVAGQVTSEFFNVSGDNNWSCASCVWDSTKCVNMNISNISQYKGLNLSAENIVGSVSDPFGFLVWCCNDNGAVCYAPYMNKSNGVFDACGLGYSEHVLSLSFNQTWNVTSCIDGFN